MKQNFFDEIDTDWGDLISDVYNSDIITIEPKNKSDILTHEDIINYPNIKNANHIIIAEGVRVIDKNAFNDYNIKNKLDNVKTIKFPSTLEVINKFACVYLENLHTIELNGNIDTIDEAAFFNCKKLKNVIFNGTVKNINDSAFNGCDIIGELKFPKGLETIGPSAFKNNKNITRVIFPEGLMLIGLWAFKDCAGISGDVIIPKSTNYVSYAAFRECNNIKRIFINKDEFDDEWIHGFNKERNTEIIYY